MTPKDDKGKLIRDDERGGRRSRHSKETMSRITIATIIVLAFTFLGVITTAVITGFNNKEIKEIQATVDKNHKAVVAALSAINIIIFENSEKLDLILIEIDTGSRRRTTKEEVLLSITPSGSKVKRNGDTIGLDVASILATVTFLQTITENSTTEILAAIGSVNASHLLQHEDICSKIESSLDDVTGQHDGIFVKISEVLGNATEQHIVICTKIDEGIENATEQHTA